MAVPQPPAKRPRIENSIENSRQSSALTTAGSMAKQWFAIFSSADAPIAPDTEPSLAVLYHARHLQSPLFLAVCVPNDNDDATDDDARLWHLAAVHRSGHVDVYTTAPVYPHGLLHVRHRVNELVGELQLWPTDFAAHAGTFAFHSLPQRHPQTKRLPDSFLDSAILVGAAAVLLLQQLQVPDSICIDVWYETMLACSRMLQPAKLDTLHDPRHLMSSIDAHQPLSSPTQALSKPSPLPDMTDLVNGHAQVLSRLQHHTARIRLLETRIVDISLILSLFNSQCAVAPAAHEHQLNVKNRESYVQKLENVYRESPAKDRALFRQKIQEEKIGIGQLAQEPVHARLLAHVQIGFAIDQAAWDAEMLMLKGHVRQLKDELVKAQGEFLRRLNEIRC